MSAVCLGCAMKLSHHSASIKTRLAQLQVQPDASLRTALEGISEVGFKVFFIIFNVCHVCCLLYLIWIKPAYVGVYL